MRPKTIIADSENPQKLSSKRIAALILVTCMAAVVVGNMFFGLDIDEFIFSGLTETVIWSLGFVGAEKLTSAIPVKTKKPPKRDSEEDMA